MPPLSPTSHLSPAIYRLLNFMSYHQLYGAQKIIRPRHKTKKLKSRGKQMRSLGKAQAARSLHQNYKLYALTFVALAGMAWAISAHAWPSHHPSAELSQALHATLARSDDAPLLSAVYVGENLSPYWLDDNGLNDRGQQALATLHGAQAHGISPNRYHVDDIEALLVNDTSPEQLAQADLLISAGLVHLAQDLNAGISKANWHDALGATDTRPDAATLWPAIYTSDSLADYMQTQAPHHTLYTSLQSALADYVAIAQRGGWPQIEAGPSLKPGMTDARTASLAKLLILTGDLKSDTAPTGTRYEGALVEAVKHFQEHHGLEADGAVGPATLAALNVPVQQRIDQIRVTLDQLRQLPDALGDKYVLINLPAYRLSAVEHGKEVLNMNVVVGQPTRPTPGFTNAITQAVFNPTWSVPTRIAREDFPRKLQANPDFLAQNGFSVSQNGVPVDVSEVNWQNVSSYSLRQSSGHGNALGKIKFPLPDNQSVYLHDTAHRELFAQADRALSSGCIRLAHPEDLTQFVLNGNEGWDKERIERTYAATTPRTVSVKAVPVYAVYWTAWADKEGTPYFYRDIYKRDGRVIAALDTTPSTSGSTQVASR